MDNSLTERAEKWRKEAAGLYGRAHLAASADQRKYFTDLANAADRYAASLESRLAKATKEKLETYRAAVLVDVVFNDVVFLFNIDIP